MAHLLCQYQVLNYTVNMVPATIDATNESLEVTTAVVTYPV
jgi:hypothetical protein